MRVFVAVDEIGPNRAQKTLEDSKADATLECNMFGETRIYEYRLVDKRARAVVAPGKERS